MVYSTATAAVIADIVRQCQPQIDAFAADMLEYVYALVYAERNDTIDPENVNWRPKGGCKKAWRCIFPCHHNGDLLHEILASCALSAARAIGRAPSGRCGAKAPASFIACTLPAPRRRATDPDQGEAATIVRRVGGGWLVVPRRPTLLSPYLLLLASPTRQCPRRFPAAARLITPAAGAPVAYPVMLLCRHGDPCHRVQRRR